MIFNLVTSLLLNVLSNLTRSAWKATLRLRSEADKTIRPDDDSRAQLEHAQIKL